MVADLVPAVDERVLGQRRDLGQRRSHCHGITQPPTHTHHPRPVTHPCYVPAPMLADPVVWPSRQQQQAGRGSLPHSLTLLSVALKELPASGHEERVSREEHRQPRRVTAGRHQEQHVPTTSCNTTTTTTMVKASSTIPQRWRWKVSWC